MKTLNKPRIASLSPIQIQSLRNYEKEMNVILVAYQKSKEEKNGNK
jgi:hypothetical protein